MKSEKRYVFVTAYALIFILGTFLLVQRAEATAAAGNEGRAVSAPALVSKPLAAVAPDRIIVKFKDSLTAPADRVFASGGSFAAVTVSKGDELDRMNERFGVRSIVPLFAPHSPAHGKEQLWQTHSARSEIFSDSFNKVKQKYARRSARAKQHNQLPDLSHVYVLTLPVGTDIAAACRSYAANPNVAYAVPSQVMQPQAFVNDPYFSSQGAWGNSYDDLWALKKIKADVAWDTARGDGVVVAVVDTGLDYTHPDIAANVWSNSAEQAGTSGVDDDGNGFVDDIRGVSFEYVDQKLVGRSEVMDTDGHGTFVAGIIAAVGDNNAGTVGVAPDATIMPVRVMAYEGYGNTEPYVKGILYAAMNGADIINLSWGCSDCRSSAGNPVVADAIAVAQGLGAIVVTSAGNQRSDVKDAFPAGLEQVITVASSDENDANSPFSNRGYLVDLAAPGGGGWQGGIVDHYSILSLRSSQAGTTAGQPVGSGYLRGSGTSASAAYVSGVAALLLSANPALTGEQVVVILRKSADDQLGSPFDTPGYDPYLGWGRLNAARAVAMALSPPADPPLLTVPDPGFNFNVPQTLCGQERSFSFDIYNTGGGTLNWSLAAPSWLAPLTSSGANFSSPVLKIMADQPVSGGVSITSNGSGSGSLNLPVTVAVRPDIKLTNCAMPIATAAGNQEWDKARNPNPPAIPDGAGGAYYVWYGPASFTPGDYKIFLQHLDSSGNPLWAADGIRVSSADKFQYRPTLISDGAGGVVVLWVEGLNTIDYADKNISVQRVNSAGQLLWGTGGVHVTQGGNVTGPVILPDGLGGALVGWTHLGANDDLYVQRVSANGTLLWQQSGYPLSVASDEQFALQGVADGSGGAWFTWIDRRNPFHDVYAQHLDRDGAALWPANGKKLNQSSAGSTSPNLVSDGAGGAIIAWFDFRNHPMSGDAYYSAGYDIYAVHLDSAGQDLWTPAEQQLLSGTAVALLGGVNMLSDGQGGAVLSWLDIRSQNTAVKDKKEIYSQRINGAGQPLWSPGGVKVLAADGWDIAPIMIADGDSGAFVAWQDKQFGSFDIYLQHLRADGSLRWGSNGIWAHSGTKEQTAPYLVPLSGGRLAITWNDWSNFFQSGIDIKGEIVQLCSDPDGDGYFAEGGVCGEVKAGDPVLTVQLAGPGRGIVKSQPSGIFCGADCRNPYAAGSVITLRAEAAPSSHFSGWLGGGCSGNGECTVTLSADTTVRAQFSAARPVKIAENSATIYTSPQQAYNNALDGNTIVSWAQTFEENLTINLPVSVQLKGGYDTDFVNNDNTSVIKGKVVISNGAVTVDRIVIR